MKRTMRPTCPPRKSIFTSGIMIESGVMDKNSNIANHFAEMEGPENAGFHQVLDKTEARPLRLP